MKLTFSSHKVAGARTCTGRKPCAVSRPALRAAVRPSTRTAVTADYEVETEDYYISTDYEPSPYSEPVDIDVLNKRLENKYKALIALEEQARPTEPVVRVRFQKKVALGEAWKICGRVPELGRFTPEIAPYMKWSEGDWWTYENHIRPGTWTFKLVLRRPDGAYIWETGPDRVLEVPEYSEEVIEMPITDVRLPY